MGLLSLAIWLPIVAGVVLLALGRDEQARSVRWIALLAAAASFLVTLPLVSGFDSGTAAMQFQEKAAWIARFNVRYHLGVDGLSLWFVPLTAFITLIVVISFLGGLQLMAIGVLGEYLARLFVESKGRPLYLVDELRAPTPGVRLPWSRARVEHAPAKTNIA